MGNPQCIGIFYNTKSALGKGVKVYSEIASILKSKSIDFRGFNEGWPESIDSFDQCWIIGGDGTIHYFVNKYRFWEKPIAIFSAGTGNDFYNHFYRGKSIDSVIETALIHHVIQVDVPRCNDRFYVNSAGIGFDGEVLKNVNLIRWIGGKVGYYLAIIKTIFSYQEQHYKLSSSTFEFTDRYLLINVANSTSTGGGFAIAPLAQLNDGLVDVVLCTKLKLFRRVQALLRVEKGNHFELPWVRFEQVNHFNVSCDSNVYYHLDGELLSGNTFRFSMSDHKMLILADDTSSS